MFLVRPLLFYFCDEMEKLVCLHSYSFLFFTVFPPSFWKAHHAHAVNVLPGDTRASCAAPTGAGPIQIQ